MADGRLVDTSDVALERDLLRAAAEEMPPVSARVRALAGLGLLGVAGTSAPAAAAALSTVPSPAAPSAAAGVFGWSWFTKLGLLAVVGTGVAGGVLVVEQSVSSTGTSVPSTPPSASAQAPSLEAPLSSPVVQQLPVEEDSKLRETPRLTSPKTRRLVPVRPAPEKKPVVGAVSIREEVRLLDRAKAALSRGEPEAALTALTRYDSRYPNGMLQREAKSLRAEALRQRGNRAVGDGQ